VVAYSGEKDRQKQAADMMAEAMRRERLTLAHVVGPGMGHDYDAGSRAEIDRRLDRIARRGRNAVPDRVRFTTYTLRYNKSFWLRVDGLERHWERADVDSLLMGSGAAVQTRNVSALTIAMGPGECPLLNPEGPTVQLDGLRLKAANVLSDRSWATHFRKVDGTWEAVKSADDGTLRKRHGLQGPIDDAFLDSFLMVRPTGKPLNEKVGAWVKGELAHALEHWRKQFRGDARVKDDGEVTEKDAAEHNLVLWGDPSSNKVLAKVAAKLPVRWDAKAVTVGKAPFDAAHCVALLIYPNPLNPKRYVVLNSGFTYREYDYLNNARQVPRLPDYAVLDVRTPPTSQAPGKVVTAGFFDERWKLAEDKAKVNP
jgi:hypothetical protein